MTRPPPRGRRGGIALVSVVLLTLALSALAHGLLVLSRFQYRASRAGVDVLAARLAAEAALLVEPRAWSPESHDVLLPWQSSGEILGTLGGARSSSVWTRLSRELWWIEARGWTDATPAGPWITLVWTLEPAARVASAPAVLAYGSEFVVTGTVDGSRFLSRPDTLPPDGCDAWLAALDTLGAPGRAPATLQMPADVQLGRLPLDSLVYRLPTSVAGSGTPEPLDSLGVCRTGPWRWGDPGRVGAPCEGQLAEVSASGPLDVRGGVGQGLLVVAGDLTATDFLFKGMVVVGGDATLAGDTYLEGMLRTGGAVNVGAGATVRGSACWAAAALAGTVVRAPLGLPEARRLRAFR